jgi:hypothetical protein
MPPSVEDRLRDIVEAINEIEIMLGGCNLDEFASDKMRRMATERYLEVICETTRRLTDEIKQSSPHMADNYRFRKPAASRVSCNRRQNGLGHPADSRAVAQIFRRSSNS